MVKSVIRIFLCCLLAGSFSCKTTSGTKAEKAGSGATVTTSASTLEVDILKEVNEYRKKKGLPALKSNSVIATEASLHSHAMARKQVAFGHGGYGARVKRISQRLEGIVGSAENVAFGNMSAADVVKRWINSPTHRKNIEGPYNLTGIGVSKDVTGRFYYTQLFIRK